MILHLACIMDGNRRWAQQQRMISFYGHSQGLKTAKLVIQFCIKKKIKYLSLYTFSVENFSRTEEEKNYLFNQLFLREGEKIILDFKKAGIKVKIIGNIELFPESIQLLCNRMEKETAHLDILQVNLLFGYGSRQEIVAATKKIIDDVQKGIVIKKDITTELFSDYLWTKDIPDPEIVIRCGKVVRLSNFLLYQSAYSEWYFADKLWPEMTENEFEKALEYFNKIKRNFGT